jgi:hypothetical protein
MNIEQLLKKHFSGEVAEGGLKDLEAQVLSAIKTRELRRTRLHSFFWAGLLIISAIGFIFSAANAYTQFGNSGAGDLIRVAISDSNLVLSHSSDFFYSLAETVPFLPIATGLAATAVILTALSHLVIKDKRIILNKLNYGAR